MRLLQEAGVTIHVTKEKTTNAQDVLLFGVMQAYARAHEQVDDRLDSR